MALNDYCRRLHGLFVNPDHVAAVDQPPMWLTDRYVLVDPSTFDVSPATAELTAGEWYQMRRTRPPVGTPGPPFDGFVKVVTQLLAKAGKAAWQPLTATPWAVSQGEHGHARVLLTDGGRPVLVNSDLLTRWEDAAHPKRLRLEHSTTVAPVRASVISYASMAAGGREEYTTLAGYIMPINARDVLPPLPEIKQEAA